MANDVLLLSLWCLENPPAGQAALCMSFCTLSTAVIAAPSGELSARLKRHRDGQKLALMRNGQRFCAGLKMCEGARPGCPCQRAFGEHLHRNVRHGEWYQFGHRQFRSADPEAAKEEEAPAVGACRGIFFLRYDHARGESAGQESDYSDFGCKTRVNGRLMWTPRNQWRRVCLGA